MKFFVLIIIIFITFTPTLYAQEPDSSVLKTNLSLRFIEPNSNNFRLNKNNLQMSNSDIFLNNSSVTSSIGFLFETLKFTSVFDQFLSTPAFDSRAYRPSSFSDYNNYIERNYMLLNKTKHSIWPVQ